MKGRSDNVRLGGFRMDDPLTEGAPSDFEEEYRKPASEVAALSSGTGGRTPATAGEPVSYCEARRFNGRVGRSISGS